MLVPLQLCPSSILLVLGLNISEYTYEQEGAKSPHSEPGGHQALIHR